MIKELVEKGRSVRNYQGGIVIEQDMLESLADLARLSPSGGNVQPLKYFLAPSGKNADLIFPLTHWAMRLKDIKLPFEGMEPSAYIVICADTNLCKDPKVCDMDVGIAAQSMMLGAVEKGLNGCFLATFSAAQVQEALQLPEHLVPRLILALGKAAESVEIVPVPESGDVGYYRSGMTNYVPKRSLEDVIINR